MNKPFITVPLAILGFTTTVLNAGVGVTGPAVRGAGTGIALGDFAAIIVSTDGTGFSNVSFTEGEALNLAESYGVGFALLQTGSVINSLGTLQFNANFTTELINGISQGDSFAVISFNTSLNDGSGAIDGDTFNIWTSPSWVIPADGSNFTFTTGTVGSSNFATATGLPVITGTVIASAVPEPSSFAALAGLGILGFAAMRKRRRA